MIQRIQTVYLFLAAILNGLLFIVPFGCWTFGPETEALLIFRSSGLGFSSPLGSLWVVLATIVPTVLLLIAIFLYGNRKKQIHLLSWAVIPQGLLAALLVYVQQSILTQAGSHVEIRPGLFFPIIGLSLMYLAFRRIRADEALVRSIDRIR